MPKLYLYLIIVWSVICASGLGVFLLEVFGPSLSVDGSDSAAINPAVGIAFWLFLWVAPVTVITIVSRRHGQQKGQE